MTLTTNYGWSKPDPGADENTWGDELNTTIDDIDNDLKATSDAVGEVKLLSGTATLAATVDLALSTSYRAFRLYVSDVKHSTAAQLGLQLSLNSGGSYTVAVFREVVGKMEEGVDTAIVYTSSSAGGADHAFVAMTGGVSASSTSARGRYIVDLIVPRSGDTGVNLSVHSVGTFFGTTGFAAATSLAHSPQVNPTHLRLAGSTGTISLRYALYGIQGL